MIDFAKAISGGAYDTLWCLFLHGPTWDGNIPSKAGRGELIDGGYVVHLDGYASLTEEGLKLALAAGMGDKKEASQRKRSSTDRRQHRAFVAMMIGLKAFVEPPQDGGFEDWMPKYADRFDGAVADYIEGRPAE